MGGAAILHSGGVTKNGLSWSSSSDFLDTVIKDMDNDRTEVKA